MTVYQRILKLLSVLLVAYAGCMIAAGLLCAGVGFMGAELQLEIEGGVVSGGEASALLIVLGVTLTIGGLLELVVGILGLRGARRPACIRPFMVFATLFLVASIVHVVWNVFSGGIEGNNLITLLVPLLIQTVALYCAVAIRRAYVKGEVAEAAAEREGLGFIRVIQVLFAINIIATLVSCTMLISGSYTLDFSDILDFTNLVFDGVSFWLIMQRSKGTRWWIVGFSAFNIVVGTVYNLATGQFDFFDQLTSSAFDIVLLVYFLVAKRPREVLVHELTLRRCKEMAVEAWDLWQPNTWSFWRSMIIYYCLFSIVGHWMEAGFCLFIKWGIVPGIYDPNSGIWRDYLNPFPVYGAGMVACALLLFPIKNLLQQKLGGIWKPLVASFIVNSLVCAGIELALGLVSNMPDANGVYPLWDYSTMPFNFMGQICLQNTLLFGVVATLMTWVVYPALQRQYLGLPEDVRKVLFVAVIVFYALVMCLYVINFSVPEAPAVS